MSLVAIKNKKSSMKNFLFLLFFFTPVQLFAQTTIQGNFTHNGINRTYRLYIPAAYNPGFAVPLVLNLHGYSSNALEQELYSNFKPIADTANFLIVHPDGTDDGTGNQFWNSVGAPNVDDVDFLSALIDTISSNYTVDQNCIYSTGMSNGGFMSHKLACDLGSKITAIASVTGTMTWNEYNNCTPQHPTPVMQVHGTADPIVPYYGSMSVVAVDSVVNFWVLKNNCDSIPIYTSVTDINQNDGCTAEHYLYPNGNNGASVELYKIIDGGHTWPGSLFVIGVTNQDFSASAEIWKFFRKYKLNVLTSQQGNYQGTLNGEKIYPNPSSGDLTIEFKNVGYRQIYVSDLLGRIDKYFYCSGGDFNFFLDKQGVYFITITEGGCSFTHKVVIF